MDNFLIIFCLAAIAMTVSLGYGRYAREYADELSDDPPYWFLILIFEESFYQWALIAACILLSIAVKWWLGLVLLLGGYFTAAFLGAIIKRIIADHSKSWVTLKFSVGLISEIALAIIIFRILPSSIEIAGLAFHPAIPMVVTGILFSRGSLSEILAKFKA